jgi:hypothetical protein
MFLHGVHTDKFALFYFTFVLLRDTQTGTEIYAKREEKHRTPKEKMEGPALP